MLKVDLCVDKILSLRQETNPLVDGKDRQRQRIRAADFFEGNRDLVFINQMSVEGHAIDMSLWPVELLPPKRCDTLVSETMYLQMRQYFSEVYNED